MHYRIWAGIIAAFLYNIWVGEYWFNPRLSPAETLISEYANPAEPFSGIVRLADIVTGIILFIIVMSFIFRKWSPKCLVNQRTWCLYQVFLLSWLFFALSTIGDAVFPLNCSAEGSVILTGKCFTANNVIHEVTSTTAGFSAFMMIIAGSISFSWMTGKQITMRNRYCLALYGIGIAHILSASLCFLSVLAPIHYPGYLQRLSVLCLSLWWVVYIRAWQSLKSRLK